MRIVGRARPRIRFDANEVALLDQLLRDLDATLARDRGGSAERASAPPPDPVHDRLFPAGYEDDEAAREFRDLTESTLHGERRERIDRCRNELSGASGGGDIGIGDEDRSRRWLQVLNDLRLVHGTQLGVREDTEGSVPGPAAELDPDDPDQLPWLIYHWLSGAQDLIVRSVIGD